MGEIKETNKKDYGTTMRSVRIPNEMLTELRTIQANTLVSEDRNVTMGEIIITALKNHIRNSNVKQA